MNRVLVALLVCFSVATFAADEVIAHPVPAAILQARTATLLFAILPTNLGTSSSLLKGQRRIEELFTRWNRFRIVKTGAVNQGTASDLVIIVASNQNGTSAWLDVFGPSGPDGEKLWSEDSYDLSGVVKSFRKSIELAERKPKRSTRTQ